MLRQRCRFTFKDGGAEVRQRRIGDTTYMATFTVIRPDGEEKTFRHGLGDYIAAYAFATAESVAKVIDGKDHPLMQAATTEGSAAG